MKIGDKYECIKTYSFNGTLYFIENKTYTIKDIIIESPDDKIIFGNNDGTDEDMFMWMDEMGEHFIFVPFKFGR